MEVGCIRKKRRKKHTARKSCRDPDTEKYYAEIENHPSTKLLSKYKNAMNVDFSGSGSSPFHTYQNNDFPDRNQFRNSSWQGVDNTFQNWGGRGGRGWGQGRGQGERGQGERGMYRGRGQRGTFKGRAEKGRGFPYQKNFVKNGTSNYTSNGLPFSYGDEHIPFEYSANKRHRAHDSDEDEFQQVESGFDAREYRNSSFEEDSNSQKVNTKDVASERKGRDFCRERQPLKRKHSSQERYHTHSEKTDYQDARSHHKRRVDSHGRSVAEDYVVKERKKMYKSSSDHDHSSGRPRSRGDAGNHLSKSEYRKDKSSMINSPNEKKSTGEKNRSPNSKNGSKNKPLADSKEKNDTDKDNQRSKPNKQVASTGLTNDDRTSNSSVNTPNTGKFQRNQFRELADEAEKSVEPCSETETIKLSSKKACTNSSSLISSPESSKILNKSVSPLPKSAAIFSASAEKGQAARHLLQKSRSAESVSEMSSFQGIESGAKSTGVVKTVPGISNIKTSKSKVRIGVQRVTNSSVNVPSTNVGGSISEVMHERKMALEIQLKSINHKKKVCGAEIKSNGNSGNIFEKFEAPSSPNVKPEATKFKSNKSLGNPISDESVKSLSQDSNRDKHAANGFNRKKYDISNQNILSGTSTGTQKPVIDGTDSSELSAGSTFKESSVKKRFDLSPVKLGRHSHFERSMQKSVPSITSDCPSVTKLKRTKNKSQRMTKRSVSLPETDKTLNLNKQNKNDPCSDSPESEKEMLNTTECKQLYESRDSKKSDIHAGHKSETSQCNKFKIPKLQKMQKTSDLQKPIQHSGISSTTEKGSDKMLKNKSLDNVPVSDIIPVQKLRTRHASDSAILKEQTTPFSIKVGIELTGNNPDSTVRNGNPLRVLDKIECSDVKNVDCIKASRVDLETVPSKKRHLSSEGTNFCNAQKNAKKPKISGNVDKELSVDLVDCEKTGSFVKQKLQQITKHDLQKMTLEKIKRLKLAKKNLEGHGSFRKLPSSGKTKTQTMSKCDDSKEDIGQKGKKESLDRKNREKDVPIVEITKNMPQIDIRCVDNSSKTTLFREKKQKHIKTSSNNRSHVTGVGSEKGKVQTECSVEKQTKCIVEKPDVNSPSASPNSRNVISEHCHSVPECDVGSRKTLHETKLSCDCAVKQVPCAVPHSVRLDSVGVQYEHRADHTGKLHKLTKASVDRDFSEKHHKKTSSSDKSIIKNCSDQEVVKSKSKLEQEVGTNSRLDNVKKLVDVKQTQNLQKVSCKDSPNVKLPERGLLKSREISHNLENEKSKQHQHEKVIQMKSLASKISAGDLVKSEQQRKPHLENVSKFKQQQNNNLQPSKPEIHESSTENRKNLSVVKSQDCMIRSSFHEENKETFDHNYSKSNSQQVVTANLEQVHIKNSDRDKQRPHQKREKSRITKQTEQELSKSQENCNILLESAEKSKNKKDRPLKNTELDKSCIERKSEIVSKHGVSTSHQKEKEKNEQELSKSQENCNNPQDSAEKSENKKDKPLKNTVELDKSCIERKTQIVSKHDISTSHQKEKNEQELSKARESCNNPRDSAEKSENKKDKPLQNNVELDKSCIEGKSQTVSKHDINSSHQKEKEKNETKHRHGITHSYPERAKNIGSIERNPNRKEVQEKCTSMKQTDKNLSKLQETCSVLSKNVENEKTKPSKNVINEKSHIEKISGPNLGKSKPCAVHDRNTVSKSETTHSGIKSKQQEKIYVPENLRNIGKSDKLKIQPQNTSHGEKRDEMLTDGNSVKSKHNLEKQGSVNVDSISKFENVASRKRTTSSDGKLQQESNFDQEHIKKSENHEQTPHMRKVVYSKQFVEMNNEVECGSDAKNEMHGLHRHPQNISNDSGHQNMFNAKAIKETKQKEMVDTREQKLDEDEFGDEINKTEDHWLTLDETNMSVEENSHSTVENCSHTEKSKLSVQPIDLGCDTRVNIESLPEAQGEKSKFNSERQPETETTNLSTATEVNAIYDTENDPSCKISHSENVDSLTSRADKDVTTTLPGYDKGIRCPEEQEQDVRSLDGSRNTVGQIAGELKKLPQKEIIKPKNLGNSNSIRELSSCENEKTVFIMLHESNKSPDVESSKMNSSLSSQSSDEALMIDLDRPSDKESENEMEAGRQNDLLGKEKNDPKNKSEVQSARQDGILLERRRSESESQNSPSGAKVINSSEMEKNVLPSESLACQPSKTVAESQTGLSKVVENSKDNQQNLPSNHMLNDNDKTGMENSVEDRYIADPERAEVLESSVDEVISEMRNRGDTIHSTDQEPLKHRSNGEKESGIALANDHCVPNILGNARDRPIDSGVTLNHLPSKLLSGSEPHLEMCITDIKDNAISIEYKVETSESELENVDQYQNRQTVDRHEECLQNKNSEKGDMHRDIEKPVSSMGQTTLDSLGSDDDDIQVLAIYEKGKLINPPFCNWLPGTPISDEVIGRESDECEREVQGILNEQVCKTEENSETERTKITVKSNDETESAPLDSSVDGYSTEYEPVTESCSTPENVLDIDMEDDDTEIRNFKSSSSISTSLALDTYEDVSDAEEDQQKASTGDNSTTSTPKRNTSALSIRHISPIKETEMEQDILSQLDRPLKAGDGETLSFKIDRMKSLLSGLGSLLPRSSKSIAQSTEAKLRRRSFMEYQEVKTPETVPRPSSVPLYVENEKPFNPKESVPCIQLREDRPQVESSCKTGNEVISNADHFAEAHQLLLKEADDSQQTKSDDERQITDSLAELQKLNDKSVCPNGHTQKVFDGYRIMEKTQEKWINDQRSIDSNFKSIDQSCQSREETSLCSDPIETTMEKTSVVNVSALAMSSVSSDTDNGTKQGSSELNQLSSDNATKQDSSELIQLNNAIKQGSNELNQLSSNNATEQGSSELMRLSSDNATKQGSREVNQLSSYNATKQGSSECNQLSSDNATKQGFSDLNEPSPRETYENQVLHNRLPSTNHSTCHTKTALPVVMEQDSEPLGASKKRAKDKAEGCSNSTNTNLSGVNISDSLDITSGTSIPEHQQLSKSHNGSSQELILTRPNSQPQNNVQMQVPFERSDLNLLDKHTDLTILNRSNLQLDNNTATTNSPHTVPLINNTASDTYQQVPPKSVKTSIMSFENIPALKVKHNKILIDGRCLPTYGKIYPQYFKDVNKKCVACEQCQTLFNPVDFLVHIHPTALQQIVHHDSLLNSYVPCFSEDCQSGRKIWEVFDYIRKEEIVKQSEQTEKITALGKSSLPQSVCSTSQSTFFHSTLLKSKSIREQQTVQNSTNVPHQQLIPPPNPSNRNKFQNTTSVALTERSSEKDTQQTSSNSSSHGMTNTSPSCAFYQHSNSSANRQPNVNMPSYNETPFSRPSCAFVQNTLMFASRQQTPVNSSCQTTFNRPSCAFSNSQKNHSVDFQNYTQVSSQPVDVRNTVDVSRVAPNRNLQNNRSVDFQCNTQVNPHPGKVMNAIDIHGVPTGQNLTNVDFLGAVPNRNLQNNHSVVFQSSTQASSHSGEVMNAVGVCEVPTGQNLTNVNILGAIQNRNLQNNRSVDFQSNTQVSSHSGVMNAIGARGVPTGQNLANVDVSGVLPNRYLQNNCSADFQSSRQVSSQLGEVVNAIGACGVPTGPNLTNVNVSGVALNRNSSVMSGMEYKTHNTLQQQSLARSNTQITAKPTAQISHTVPQSHNFDVSATTNQLQTLTVTSSITRTQQDSNLHTTPSVQHQREPASHYSQQQLSGPFSSLLSRTAQEVQQQNLLNGKGIEKMPRSAISDLAISRKSICSSISSNQNKKELVQNSKSTTPVMQLEQNQSSRSLVDKSFETRHERNSSGIMGEQSLPTRNTSSCSNEKNSPAIENGTSPNCSQVTCNISSSNSEVPNRDSRSSPVSSKNDSADGILRLKDLTRSCKYSLSVNKFINLADRCYRNDRFSTESADDPANTSQATGPVNGVEDVTSAGSGLGNTDQRETTPNKEWSFSFPSLNSIKKTSDAMRAFQVGQRLQFESLMVMNQLVAHDEEVVKKLEEKVEEEKREREKLSKQLSNIEAVMKNLMSRTSQKK